jgi:hypothetical protein
MNVNDLFLLVRVLYMNRNGQLSVSILDGEGAASRRLQVADLIIVNGGAAIPTEKGMKMGDELIVRLRRAGSGLRVV